MTEWISVKDRLPSEDGEYICTCSHPESTIVTSLSFDNGLFSDDGHGQLWDQFVTDWMPLPEPAGQEML